MSSQPCILYYDHRSICSSMVRYVFENAGAPRESTLPLSLKLQPIDIFKGEQLTEFYLTSVNPKGQVPVLSSPGFLEKPITDSLDITYWLCDRYRDLRPAKFEEQINQLLKQLHVINFFTLSMRNKPKMAASQEETVLTRLNQPDILESYKKALEYKLQVTRSEKVEGVRSQTVTTEIERARALLKEIDTVRASHTDKGVEGGWVFGTVAPTALDCTVICLVARLMDVKLEEIVPERLLAQTEKAREMEDFKSIWTVMK